MTTQTTIRNARPEDFNDMLALDFDSIKEEKQAYWRGIFDRYASNSNDGGFFLVAEAGFGIIGFIVGEIRAWEFGSPPCGWVFALSVSPEQRERGVGQRMLDEMCQQMKQAGVTTMRTMVDRESKLTLSFFRSQGLRTGRYIELEKSLDDI